MAKSCKVVDASYCAVESRKYYNSWPFSGKTWQSATWCRLGSVPKDTFVSATYWEVV